MYVGIGIRHTQQIMCPVAGSFGPIGLFPFSGFLPFLRVCAARPNREFQFSRFLSFRDPGGPTGPPSPV